MAHTRKIWHSTLGVLVAIVVTMPTLLPIQHVDALSGSDFHSGNIIDDNIFFNSSSMSSGLVQEFLNAKVPACDINGSKPYNASMTRAQYSATKGISTPFICLRDYTQNTPGMPADPGLCNQYGAGQRTAAQIIVDVAAACGVNPQTLIILLQKEQSLITDDWPWPIQYSSATGFGCPDTAPCDASYGGFFYQVYYAARQFKKYARDASSYNYRAGRNNTIQFNPNTSCGSSTVFLENQATAGLYVYTPYQPNTSALGNLYGSGDSCSAYGNRNFWRMFNDWFGSTRYSVLPGCPEATNTSIACVWRLRKIGTDAQVLVSDISERNQFIANQGYIFVGREFFGNVAIAQQPGNIPIYRLFKPDGSTFLTTDSNERNVLIASYGYTNGSIGFYADRASSNSGYPVYRLYSPALTQHIWIGNPAERDQLIAGGWNNEGIAFTSISPVDQETAAPAGQQLVYRFSMPGNSHFWTTDINERDNMIWSGYKYEGVAWKGLSSTSGVPIYRLYAPSMKKHLYTLDPTEKDALSSTGIWNYEGIGQYMSPTPTSKPVYRLYSPITTNHLWTTDQYERSVLISNGTFRDEGVAWYQP